MTSRIVLPSPLELAELVETLVREALIADRQYLVDEDDVREQRPAAELEVALGELEPVADLGHGPEPCLGDLVGRV